MSLPTPNYVTTKDYNFYTESTGSAVLPAWSFVRPISSVYVPTHVKEALHPGSDIDETVKTYCYTHYGILLLLWSIVRKT